MVICIASGKGGTGKTTIATNLAVSLAMVAGESIVEFSDGKVSDAIRDIWHKVEELLRDKD